MARETAEVAQGKITERVAELENQRNDRQSREKKKSELDDLKNEIEETRKEVEPVFLSTYDRVSKIVSRPPYMAPIEDQNVPVATCVYPMMWYPLFWLRKKLPNVISAVELCMWKDDAGRP